ncbi:TPA_asm: P8 [Chrysanthemum trirhavirus 1]|nr:TPA_asm: P8 [Chrysanthemum trirhavirus 1]
MNFILKMMAIIISLFSIFWAVIHTGDMTLETAERSSLQKSIKSGSPRPSNKIPELFEIPIVVADLSNGIQLTQFCAPNKESQGMDVQVSFPADMRVGMYKVEYLKEWKLENFVRTCYHDGLVRKWKREHKSLERSPSLKECESFESSLNLASLLQDPECTLFSGNEISTLIQVESSEGNGMVGYKNGSRYLHSTKMNLHLHGWGSISTVAVSGDYCVKFTVSRQIVNQVAELYEGYIIYKDLQIKLLTKISPSPFGEECWTTDILSEVCISHKTEVLADSEDVAPVYNNEALTKSKIQESIRDKLRIKSLFCEHCETGSEGLSSELDYLCIDSEVYKTSLLTRNEHLVYKDGKFISNGYILDPYHGVFLDAIKYGRLIRGYAKRPPYIFLNFPSGTKNCSVTTAIYQVRLSCKSLDRAFVKFELSKYVRSLDTAFIRPPKWIEGPKIMKELSGDLIDSTLSSLSFGFNVSVTWLLKNMRIVLILSVLVVSIALSTKWYYAKKKVYRGMVLVGRGSHGTVFMHDRPDRI